MVEISVYLITIAVALPIARYYWVGGAGLLRKISSVSIVEYVVKSPIFSAIIFVLFHFSILATGAILSLLVSAAILANQGPVPSLGPINEVAKLVIAATTTLAIMGASVNILDVLSGLGRKIRGFVFASGRVDKIPDRQSPLLNSTVFGALGSFYAYLMSSEFGWGFGILYIGIIGITVLLGWYWIEVNYLRRTDLDSERRPESYGPTQHR